MRYRIVHRTSYRYSEPVALSRNRAHLAPRHGDGQTVLDVRLVVDPVPTDHRSGTDAFGNQVDAFVVQEPHSTLVITATSQVVVARPAPPDPDGTEPWEALAGRGLPLDIEEYRWDSPLIPCGPALLDFAREHLAPGRPVLDGALALTRAIHRGFTYDQRATTVETPVHKALELRRGVCQDFAGVLIGALRSAGLPARYVSGYLETDPPAGRPRLVGADASHAWVQAWCGNSGWVDLDPTNGCIPGDRHITVAWGRDFSDVSPVRGMVLGGGRSEVAVAVDVARMESAASEPGQVQQQSQQ